TGNVSITLNGVTQMAAIDGSGNFSSSFATGALAVSGSPYTITYSYAGDSNFNGDVSDTSTQLTVNKATPTFSSLSGPTITYGDTPPILALTLRDALPISTGNVSITLNGVTQMAAIDGSGNFSSSFATGALAVSGSPYTITYSYAGD